MIATNLQNLRDRINEKCTACNREPGEIKLIAVSKFFGIDAINEAKSLGIIDFGENKAQELRDKFELIGSKVTWHFIGTLQRNKAKYAVKAAEYIHSVDSIQLAEELNKQAEKLDKFQNILIEVKTSEEESKAGIYTENEIVKLAEYCREKSNLILIGLMTMAPFTDDAKKIRKSFSDLRKLKDKLNNQGFDLKELSMGMTNDFEIAIEEGSTMLRIGSAIFGQREYSKDWRQL
ncbi:MAG: YggS family pyridoxal phosphate-dependent enzyme [Ignavibacteria bacterium]|nr:YggS family pyridoxal phosphate-dependent enzyme [Ignavibacteria bacterium]MBT8381932.1 YggS family pyridoxal phosphate-dependent enzyme [Ignavibacteria bacterium]MBT8390513.1 YggS family pyridoxal phosphate-dependent enzyme [Ignavibacteria bacterium]NNJ52647.1 YggS family pyridoxal phosphate-dependent enzyme [Ignavibacteriaceae bacterium]NNL21127.1 YggS family pyridoxal phosphate-dependent enzyme [Ignavibacteriaceae bacterium]